MSRLRQTFGRLVAAHRKQRGLTQEALAAAASMSVDMISRIESGATGARFSTIEKLADALKVDPSDLFSAEMAREKLGRPTLNDLTAKLARLSDDELLWIDGLLEAALRRH